MKPIRIALILLVACVGTAVAEPDDAVRFLMNDPVSLLDFGIYRLENDIRAERGRLLIVHEPPETVFVDYSWDENRIVIGLAYGVSGNPPKKKIQREIKTVFQTLKAKFRVDPKGRVFPREALSGLPEYFSHRTYVSKKQTPGP